MKRWRVDGEPGDDLLDELASVLNDGGVALLPTDTIYGLHAAATNDAAIARIAEMKGRGDDKPFVVIAASADQLRAFGANVPASLNDIWPAPLTAIVARHEKTVAVRVPDLAWLRSLLGRTGPLVSTSANRSGEPPVTEPSELAHDLQRHLDALLDGGPRQGKPSTIVDFTKDAPKLIREGDPGFAQFLRKTLRKAL